MRIVVVGAGGLGSYVGALLARADHQVTLVARGEHLAAIRRSGLHVHTVAGDFDVHPECAASALELPGADLTFVTVKAFSLDDVADQVAHLARAGSIVVPLLNGVTAGERLVERGVASDRLVEGIAYMTAFVTEPGRVERRAEHHRLVVGSSTGSDPAGLAFDALQRARAEAIDLLFIDTAGRLHNRGDLMAELQKIIRVLRKIDPAAPHSCLLVLDATVGQNAHSQVETFVEMAEITGLVVTKLDGSARGGVLVALAERFALPVHAVGVGEGAEDLRAFEADVFARNLMGVDEG